MIGMKAHKRLKNCHWLLPHDNELKSQRLEGIGTRHGGRVGYPDSVPKPELNSRETGGWACEKH